MMHTNIIGYIIIAILSLILGVLVTLFVLRIKELRSSHEADDND